MRILFDSKQLMHKDPFGTLVPDQKCTLNIHIPASVQATAVEYKETRSIKWTLASFILPLLIGITLCLFINFIGLIFV